MTNHLDSENKPKTSSFLQFYQSHFATLAGLQEKNMAFRSKTENIAFNRMFIEEIYKKYQLTKTARMCFGLQSRESRKNFQLLPAGMKYQ